ncbi:adenylate/guanylate cyclase domain-containing protein [Streptomyces sp. OfavH-34-F]|uniref:adenylate/guanylate cyclase domain-containing protein n=1 Tax=Streptomyces sp. OfavH-34-F TaxID=2917760 RepID=UPI001EF18EF8|nr:adenylate/guanylate cyclase domain-containing protein [Streptomyces sp. OfavH-34-F]MCG7527558.1 adenylate/guanylate cyclase domain-containing protein [Streptomyces sp. OfavH-34-F]
MSAGHPVEPPDGEGLPGSVEEVLLGGGRVWTRREVAARAGVEFERAVRVWRALGFPAVDDGARVFTDADVEALRTGERLIAAGLVTEHGEAMMARALGHHLSRLADWQVDTLREWMARDGDHSPGGRALWDRMAELLPEIERLQRYVWHRHLVAYAGHAFAEGRPDGVAAGTAGDGAHVRERAVGFTDMVGYTRMSRGLDGAELVRVLDRFETVTGDVVAEGRGEVVKTIGDEVLFVCESAAGAADIGLELTARAQADPKLPQVRTGLAHGPVIGRFGDVYGAAVNIAARLTAVARPASVLVNTALAGELAGMAPYALRPLRPVSVRGYSRLRPVLLRRARGAS